MAVFSRYQKVLEADGSPMPVRTALQLINSELQSFLRQEEGEADRDTQFCVSWFEQYGMASGPFGEADVLARAKNVSVEGMVRAGVLTASGGKVVLLPRDDYPTDWNPAADVRLTLWECTQQLIKRHQEGGEAATAALVARLGAGRSDDAKILAYRLHAICERKGWTEEALAYNEFVVAWPEILKKAATITGEAPQKTLDAEENE
jgi:putative DNA methylase